MSFAIELTWRLESEGLLRRVGVMANLEGDEPVGVPVREGVRERGVCIMYKTGCTVEYISPVFRTPLVRQFC